MYLRIINSLSIFVLNFVRYFSITTEMLKLYDEYKEKGLMVIGISSDDLNVKESRTGIEINNFF
jgi:glutathione peroxidase-family protein